MADTKTVNSSVQKVPKIYKEEEFEAFLQSLNEDSAGHWQKIARAIGVDGDTVTKWAKHPRAIEAKNKAIQKRLKRFAELGDRDWKAQEAMLKLLDVQASEKIDLMADIKSEVVHIYKPGKLPEGEGVLEGEIVEEVEDIARLIDSATLKLKEGE